MQKRTALSYLGLLFVTIIWGYAFVVVKNSVDAISPIYMVAMRFTLATIALMLIFHKNLRMIDKQYLKYGTVLGIMLGFAYMIQTVGIQYTTAGKNAFLTSSYVVIVPFIQWLAFRKNPGKRAVAAAFVAIAGIGLLTLRNDFTANIGDLLSLLCGLGYALHIAYIGKYNPGRDAVLLTIIQLGVTAVLAWICAPIFEGGFPTTALQPDALISLAYLGLMSTMVALVLQNVCQKYTNPSTAALIMSLESVFGVLFSVWLLHEVLSTKAIAGCVLIFAAILISELKRSDTKQKENP